MGMNIMRMKGRAKMMRTIKVTGKGKIAVKPDKIRLYVNKEGLCQEFVVKMEGVKILVSMESKSF